MKQTLLFLGFLMTFSVFSQETKTIISTYISSHLKDFGLSKDIELTIQSTSSSKAEGVKHVYVQQMHSGLPIVNSTVRFTLKNNQVFSSTGKFFAVQNESFVPAANVKSILQSWITSADTDRELEIKAIQSKNKAWTIETQFETVEVKKCFFLKENKLQSGFQFALQIPNAKHWYSVVLSTETGEELMKNDWVASCSFECASNPEKHESHSQLACPPPPGADQYLVYPLPLTHPDEGPQSLVINPSDPVYSPFGWHDTNFTTGDEFTITSGNNVFAYEDADNDDLPGFSPDGGPALNFNFPVNTVSGPPSYVDASITNLFYMNNMMHDVWAYYGFDEESGNFQVMNLTSGQGNDQVLAEAQDGSGTNNANFGTPPDGQNPRMQMYIWSGANVPDLVTVNLPSTLAGGYAASTAGFGPPVPTIPITSDIVFVVDDGTATDDGCDIIQNGAAINGKIAVVKRGNCQFNVKVENAQNAGAIAVIIYNNSGGTTTSSMSGTNPNVLIPSVMISQNDGGDWFTAYNLGETINVSIAAASNPDDNDSDLDNGIIAHEYGHGISNRLVGGPDNVDCLYNDEQMGEGWSDFFGIVMTIKPSDVGTQPRGVGTYVTNQAVTGTGIRPAPYSTDFSLNGYTYGETNNSSLSMPHGVGFVWCSMLWDLTWALIDSTNFDPNIKTGTGGNNIAMALVIEGLKLTACNPGFVDGRNAILEADQLLYGGAHECTIWKVFARRGLGYSADQGDPMSRTDQVEAFDLPPNCMPDFGAGISENVSLFDVYPNPTNGKIEIKGDISSIETIEVCAMNGQKLLNFVDPNMVSLEGLSTGVYLLRISSDKGSSVVRVIKK
jgi:hypothetical protein